MSEVPEEGEAREGGRCTWKVGASFIQRDDEG